MPKVQVFDPAMCCPTGVCGPEVDPALVRFAADLDWLASSGAQVERFNLSQQPAAFVANAEVAAAMRARDDALPLVLVDGKIFSQGRYPARAELAALLGQPAPKDLPASARRAAACCAPGDRPPVAIGGAPPKKCC